METKQVIRVDAYRLLATGMGANEVAKELDLNYRLVCKLKRDLSLYTLDECIASIDTEDELVELLELLKNNVPEQLQGKITTLKKGLTGLQAIQNSMQNDLKDAMDIGRKMMDKQDLKPSEWVMLVNGMTTLYNAIFNKNTGTQVNINAQTNTLIQQKADEKIAQLTRGILE